MTNGPVDWRFVTEDGWKLYEAVVGFNLLSFPSLLPVFLVLNSLRLG